MARGRPPKDPAVRRRRNKAVTAAELPAPNSDEQRKLKAPPLNALLIFGRAKGKGRVHPLVTAYWRTAWASPMAPRWLATDVQVLYDCARLHQQKFEAIAAGKSTIAIMAEIRQQEARLGLDVMSRRRLDWRIDGPRHEAPVAPTANPVAAPPPPDEPEVDPRRILRAVK